MIMLVNFIFYNLLFFSYPLSTEYKLLLLNLSYIYIFLKKAELFGPNDELNGGFQILTMGLGQAAAFGFLLPSSFALFFLFGWVWTE